MQGLVALDLRGRIVLRAWDLRVWINGRVDVLLKRWIGQRAIVCRVVPFDASVNGFVWGESLVIRIWLLRLLRLLG